MYLQLFDDYDWPFSLIHLKLHGSKALYEYLSLGMCIFLHLFSLVLKRWFIAKLCLRSLLGGWFRQLESVACFTIYHFPRQIHGDRLLIGQEKNNKNKCSALAWNWIALSLLSAGVSARLPRQSPRGLKLPPALVIAFSVLQPHIQFKKSSCKQFLIACKILTSLTFRESDYADESNRSVNN